MPTITSKELTTLKIARHHHHTVRSRLAIVNYATEHGIRELPGGLAWIGRRSGPGDAAGRRLDLRALSLAIPLSERAALRTRP